MDICAISGSLLDSPAQFGLCACLMGEELRRAPLVVFVPAMQGVARLLGEAAEFAAGGSDSFQGPVRDLEQMMVMAVKATVSLKRQSHVLANVKFRLNELEEILGGIFMLRESSPRTIDMVQGYGVWLSAYIFSEALRESSPGVVFFDAGKVLVTDGRHGRARISLSASRDLIAAKVPSGVPAVVACALGSTRSGDVTTLGRGDVESAAAVFAVALNAREVTIWTDTDGVMTADPRKVSAARTVTAMTYAEAMEMSHFGDEFIYPPALIPLMKNGVRIRVRNAMNPGGAGTVIDVDGGTPRTFTGISCVDELALLQIAGRGMIGVTGVSMRLFKTLAEAGVNVIFISQASSEQSICVGIAPRTVAVAEVRKEFARELDEHLIDEVSEETGLSIIAVVGEHMRQSRGIAARVFGALARGGVNVKAIAQGSSELNISIVIDREDQLAALGSLHHELIEKEG
ncbi:MAG: aspartate kinase [Myxococcota bacterium]|jgi:aspartokinase/homoserine dehydrogenase 1